MNGAGKGFGCLRRVRWWYSDRGALLSCSHCTGGVGLLPGPRPILILGGSSSFPPSLSLEENNPQY